MLTTTSFLRSTLPVLQKPVLAHQIVIGCAELLLLLLLFELEVLRGRGAVKENQDDLQGRLACIIGYK